MEKQIKGIIKKVCRIGKKELIGKMARESRMLLYIKTVCCSTLPNIQFRILDRNTRKAEKNARTNTEENSEKATRTAKNICGINKELGLWRKGIFIKDKCFIKISSDDKRLEKQII